MVSSTSGHQHWGLDNGRAARCRGPRLGSQRMQNEVERHELRRSERPSPTTDSTVWPRRQAPPNLTEDQVPFVASEPSELCLLRGYKQRRMEETIVRADDGTEVGIIACCAARPWLFGPRLGHIRVRNDEIRCRLVRYLLSEEHPRTQCQQGVPPETLHLQAAVETCEPPSQGGSAGSNPVGATYGKRPLTAVGGLSPFECGVPLGAGSLARR